MPVGVALGRIRRRRLLQYERQRDGQVWVLCIVYTDWPLTPKLPLPREWGGTIGGRGTDGCCPIHYRERETNSHGCADLDRGGWRLRLLQPLGVDNLLGWAVTFTSSPRP